MIATELIVTEIETRIQTLVQKISPHSAADMMPACAEELEALEQRDQSEWSQDAASISGRRVVLSLRSPTYT